LPPGFSDLLSKISDELDKSGGRAANVWTALTMRALQSLRVDSVPPRASEFEECPYPSHSTRADSVISKVSVLSPLVSSSQNGDLRMDLLKLANSAIDVWNHAQSGGLKIIISPLLERTQREEWRSHQFDPASPSRDCDESNSDVMYRTHPRVFTLFPRVMAREVENPIKHDTGPPGSWPSQDQVPRTIETCIHPGRGLPEWSSLVVRGKVEQEERKDYLTKALENAKKELHSTKRIAGQGRRESWASSTLSLSEQRKMEEK
jgi:hypothetical protein